MSRWILSRQANCLAEILMPQQDSSMLFYAKFELLATHRELGRERSDLHFGLRSDVVGNCIVYYRLRDDGVEIARVVHGARDQPQLFDSFED